MRVLEALRRRPVTVLIVVALVVVGLIAILSGHRGPFAMSSTGFDPDDLRERHWWVLLTSTLAPGSVLQFILAIAAAVWGIGFSERVMGSIRTIIAFLLTGIAATAIGAALELLGAQLGEYWSSSVHDLVTLDPLTPIAGTVAWATAWASPFWRRRLRVLLVAGSAALLLYSGEPADLYLMVAVGLGLLAGRLLHPGALPRFWRGSQHETRSLLALVNAVLALGPVLTLVSATRFGALAPLAVAVTDAGPAGRASTCIAARLDPGCVNALTRTHLGVGGALVTLLPLAVALIASAGLLTGRRLAVWVLAGLGVVQSGLAAWYFGILPASGSTPVPVRPAHYAELGLWLVVGTLVPLADAVLLVALRRLFPVRMTPARRRGYLIALVAAVVVPVALYLGLGWALRHQFRPVPDLAELIEQLPQRFIPISFLRHEPVLFVGGSPATHLLLQSVGPLFWGTALIATAIAMRSGANATQQAQQADRVRALLREGSGTLGYMATWTGNRLWVSSDGSTGIAYRVVAGFAVTTSDPFGAARDPEAALTEFLRFCDRAAWTPVFYSVHDDWRRRLVRRGWSSLPVAEEIVIDPRTFTLEGKPMHDVRYAVNRAARDGVHALWGRWRDLPLRVTVQISALSDDWMADKDLPELGFTLGGLDELRDDDVLVGVALDAQDAVVAVTSWLPVRTDGILTGRTLDFMRRTATGSNGVMEFLIAEGLQRFSAEGLQRASLSGSPLATAADDAHAGALGRILALVGTVLEPVYGFRSLLRFKRKFSPTLETMYLVGPDPVALPGIGLAIARCYLPGLTVAQAGRALASRR